MKIKFFILLLSIILIIAFFWGNTLLIYTDLMGLVLVGLLYLWNKYVFTRFYIQKRLNRHKVFSGEEVWLEYEIINKKIIPMFFISFQEIITAGLAFENQELIKEFNKKNDVLRDVFNMRWYERMKRRYKLKAQKRGVHTFINTTFFYTGLLGFFSNSFKAESKEELIVYPSILSLEEYGINFDHPHGAKKKQGWIYQDPLNKVGVRPYEPTDSLKKINWKASARHLQLKSDIYQPSFDPQLYIFLKSNHKNHVWHGIRREVFELAVSCAAGLVDKACKAGYEVGFYSDGIIKGMGSYTAVEPGRDEKHQERLFTTLAMLEPYPLGRLAKIMEMERKKIKQGASVYLITSHLDEQLKKVIQRYRLVYQLVVIFVGDIDNKIKLEGVKIIYINSEEVYDGK